MICDKCGKSNLPTAAYCAYCKTPMPQTSGSSGFSDILKYNAPTAAETVNVVPTPKPTTEGISEEDMRKLMQKSDNIMESTRKNSRLGLIAMILSICILVGLVAVGVGLYIVNDKLNQLLPQEEAVITPVEDVEEPKEDEEEPKEDEEEPTDSPKTVTYTIQLPKNVEHGKVKVTEDTAKQGDTVIITAEPDAMYQLKKLEIAGKDVTDDVEEATGTYEYELTLDEELLENLENEEIPLTVEFEDIIKNPLEDN